MANWEPEDFPLEEDLLVDARELEAIAHDCAAGNLRIEESYQ